MNQRIHVGCGPIYLRGWVNIDLALPGTHLATERSDLVDALSTDEDNYYARHESLASVDNLRTARNWKGVCDAYWDGKRLPVNDGSVTEILSRQVFEHFSVFEARNLLCEFRRVLDDKGIVRIDVPDHDATVALLMSSHDPFYFRHLYGSRTSDYGYHLMSYTRDGLRRLCEESGLVYESEEKNIHFYPAFCLRFRLP